MIRNILTAFAFLFLFAFTGMLILGKFVLDSIFGLFGYLKRI